MTFDEFCNVLNGFSGEVLAQLTDRYHIGDWPADKDLLKNDEDKILEVRIFDSTAEHKLFRSHIGKPFKLRSIDDTKDPRDHYDQKQYLNKGYPEPNDTNVSVIIRIYFEGYDSLQEGLAKISDWRVVGFVKGE